MKRLIPIALLAALAGCGKPLFPDDMSPTQLQERQMNDGGGSWTYYNMEEGDNEDPCVDNGNYPDMSNPWWNAPGYSQG